ncbi:MAG: hypothetical protein HYV68_00280 [Candidatus Taylorbacteria bacterium]|nr:hypothetical protein [Candidatus Taylorbacteria bacterium]
MSTPVENSQNAIERWLYRTFLGTPRRSLATILLILLIGLVAIALQY